MLFSDAVDILDSRPAFSGLVPVVLASGPPDEKCEPGDVLMADRAVDIDEVRRLTGPGEDGDIKEGDIPQSTGSKYDAGI
jgi:hypothetical protein